MTIQQILRREFGLPAVFSRAQLVAIAIGTVISYGVVSGSAFPLSVAGPAAVVCYGAAAMVALLLMRCLSEMVAAGATPGGFSAYAEAYLGPRTARVVRSAYLLSMVAIVGTEIAMLDRVFAWWFPTVPPALIVGGLLAGLNVVHLAGARVFGWVETALSVAKALALFALITLACLYASDATHVSTLGFRDASAGVFANADVGNMWEAFTIATMGFIGLEILSIAAAETRGAGLAIARCLRMTTWGVAALVVASVAASAWFQWHQPVAPNVAPFVQLLEFVKLPAAQLAFTVLMAVTVVSVLNCLLYGGSRMLFSMARAGEAPASLGRCAALRAPVTVVTGLALLVYAAQAWLPGKVYVAASSIAITCLLAIWGVIFAAYARFRSMASPAHPARKDGKGRGMGPGVAAGVVKGGVGTLVIVAVTGATWRVEAFAPTLRYGIPFLLLLAALAWCAPIARKNWSD